MSEGSSPGTVAVYGLGIIGSRSAEHLASAGYSVRTWNRTAKQREDFESDPLRAAEGSEVIVFYLKDVAAVREVFDMIRGALGSGKTVVNHATIDLATTSWLEEECAALGSAFLNAPFTGSKVAAGNGALVYYAGGPREVLERLRPLLEATSSRIMEVGTPTAATVLKLTTNLISASTVQALAEGLALNVAHGNSPDLFLEAIEPNACASLLASMKVPSMAAGDFDTHFSMSNMLKDARYMLDLSRSAGLQTPGIATTADRMQELCDAGFADEDFSALYRQFQPGIR